MRKYNLFRPLFLLVTAFLMNTLVSNVCMLLGMEQGLASDLGFAAMIITAIVVYTRMFKRRPPR